MAYEKCKLCGRKLKNPLYQKLGFGKVCYKKYIERQMKQKKLFDSRKKG